MDLVFLLTNYCETLKPVITIIKAVLNIIQIGIPILLILMGSIDLGRAVLSSDDKAIKESTSRLIKRVIAAVAVFFVFTIVKLIMDVATPEAKQVNGTDQKDWLDCWDYGSK